MRHSYRPECLCDRCAREKTRRTAQSLRNPQRIKPARRGRKPAWVMDRDSYPTAGSQEWAETRGDNLGLSEDR